MALKMAANTNHHTKGYRSTRPWQHPKGFKQAPYSAAVAQSFIDDGEIDNWHAYCELTGHPHPVGGAYA